MNKDFYGHDLLVHFIGGPLVILIVSFCDYIIHVKKTTRWIWLIDSISKLKYLMHIKKYSINFSDNPKLQFNGKIGG